VALAISETRLVQPLSLTVTQVTRVVALVVVTTTTTKMTTITAIQIAFTTKVC
jgi:hypothetical protein